MREGLTQFQVVKYTAKAVKSNKNAFIRAWAPSAAGLSLLPLLPVVFDHPGKYISRSHSVTSF